MKLIKPSYEILTPIDGEQILKDIEIAGRTCYKSEDKITDDSARKFVQMILGKAHESVIEHKSISVRFICDRGISYELVRHRLASFSQESSRYCNYSKDKFGNELTFIIPEWAIDKELYNGEIFIKKEAEEPYTAWLRAMDFAENSYNTLIQLGWQPQQARSVLPNSIKTEIVVTANLREWRTIFKQRTSTAAHPQMRELMIPLLQELQTKIPIIFDDI